jgi:RNA polymerase sigma factor (sigma-70 family)
MSNEASVSHWIEELKGDDPTAAEKLWLRYVEKVARLARRHFVGRRGRVANEDDVVAEVFTDFLEGVRDGRFPKLKDRHDLWQLLVMLTERKAVDQLRRQSATKRGGGLVAGESAFAKAGANGSEFAGIGQVVGGEPSPEFAAELADLFAHLLRALGDETLRTIARDTISGHTQEEIAQTVGLSVPSIQRKLRIIRDTWERELK